MSVNFYTGANQVIVKNTLTDELKTSYDDAVELVNKLGADATVEGSVAQRLAAIVANAPEKYDTLKEIATWIESDTDGAAKMQADIVTLEADKLDKKDISDWAKAETKPDYTASEINLTNGTSVESAIGTLNSNIGELKHTNYYVGIGRQTVSSQGWYRIAQFVNSDQNGRNGAIDNSIDIILKRAFGSTDNEHHELKFLSIYNNRKFVSVANLSNSQKFTKIRYTSDGFLELYYSDTNSNMFTYTILNRYDAALSGYWEKVFEKSSTTDDRVLCTFDIPEND